MEEFKEVDYIPEGKTNYILMTLIKMLGYRLLTEWGGGYGKPQYCKFKLELK